MPEAARPTIRDRRWPALLLLLVALCAGLLALEPATGNWYGLGLRRGWFIDVYALLAAGEAHQLGIPIYANNPLDLLGRPHSYPSCWLALGAWGLTRADTLWVGGLLAVAFLAVALALHRPRSGREFLAYALVLLAPPVQLGIVRGNNDLAIFLVLAPLAWCLASSRPGARLAAVGLIAAAAALKYYPIAACLLLLGEDDRRLFGWRLVVAAGSFALVGWSVWEDMQHFSTSLPSPEGIFALGAGKSLELLGFSPRLALGIGALLAAGTIAQEIRRGGARPAVPPTREEWSFMLGAVLIAACFWVTMNWGYRWIFALWMVAVLAGGHRPDFVLRRWEQRALRIALPICLWGDGLYCIWWNLGIVKSLAPGRYIELCWLALQPAHWLVACVLTMACARFAWREAGRTFAGMRSAPAA
jgi:hypothetical protein